MARTVCLNPHRNSGLVQVLLRLANADALLHFSIDHEPEMPAMDATDREELATRRSIVEACRAMDALGINQGTSGNISVRWEDGLLLTPSGLPYHEMTPDDLVHLRKDATCDHPLQPRRRAARRCAALPTPPSARPSFRRSRSRRWKIAPAAFSPTTA